jgi:hypothetical protein
MQDQDPRIEATCSNCNKLIAYIIKTIPMPGMTCKIVARCPFCKDKSFIVEIVDSLFAVAGTDDVAICEILPEGELIYITTVAKK